MCSLMTARASDWGALLGGHRELASHITIEVEGRARYADSSANWTVDVPGRVGYAAQRLPFSHPRGGGGGLKRVTSPTGSMERGMREIVTRTAQ